MKEKTYTETEISDIIGYAARLQAVKGGRWVTGARISDLGQNTARYNVCDRGMRGFRHNSLLCSLIMRIFRFETVSEIKLEPSDSDEFATPYIIKLS